MSSHGADWWGNPTTGRLNLVSKCQPQAGEVFESEIYLWRQHKVNSGHYIFFNLIFYWLFWGEFHIKYPKLSPSISAPHSHNIPQKEKWKKLIQNKTNNPVHTSIFPIPQPLYSPWCPWELWWGHGTFWSMFWVKCTHKEDLVGWYSFPFGLAFIMSKYFWVISELYESVFKNNIIFINSLRSA